MMEKERIEEIKHSVDLAALMRSRGIHLKKNGKGYVGLCPFHADKNPSLSLTPGENLWKCFGCGAGGDAIRFLELFDKIGFKEAVEKLSGTGSKALMRSGSRQAPGKCEHQQPARPGPAQAKKLDPSGTHNPSARSIKLLSRVIEFYHTAFSEDRRAREYLASRGIGDNALFSTYKIGFANGTLLNVLPEDGDLIRELKEIGVLNDKGGELFYGCVTFPLYDLNGNPAGLYGRRVSGMDKANGPPARGGAFSTGKPPNKAAKSS